MPTNDNILLNVNHLKTNFYVAQRTSDFQPIQATIKAVDDISFQIIEGTTFGLVGESGCGKTTVAYSLLNLIPYIVKAQDVDYVHLGRSGSQWSRGYLRGDSKGLTHKRITAEGEVLGGEVLYKGKDLLKMTQEDVRHYRGKEIAMIFQNPLPALHPMEFIGSQVGESITAHEQTRREKLRQLVFEYLGKVELKDIEKRYHNAPHLFSGGEGQRIMIAMALISGPALLIADEPTKSLDVIVKRQVLELLRQMKKQFNLAMLLISHDFAVVAEMADYVAFMYSGKIVENSDVVSVYKDPRHPYTRGLLASIPRLDRPLTRELHGLLGDPPDPVVQIWGCRFHPRCQYVIDKCRLEEPPLIEVKPGHLSACFRAHELPEWRD
ncbi:MAG TPA: ABC transporter ATP-binding protein [Candidatus Bathyarchaeia archaeon]|nr:ABC transporter ATP-binding protein [Candidatus Bathyarchaeia archaeon]